MKLRLLSIASGICGLAMPGHAALIAHYKFDEGAGATVAANQVAGTTGVVGTSVTTGVAGIAGNAYSFASLATQAGIVDMGNASFLPAITASGKLTYSAWVNTTDTTGNRNTVVFAGDNTQTAIYSDLGVAAGQAGNLGQASARVRPTVGTVAPQATGIYSLAAVNNGAWHLITMTVDLSAVTNHLKFYQDGVLVNSQTLAVVAFPNFNNFEIGRLGRSAPTDAYSGLIDDVQVYDSALSASEVGFLFANPGTSVPEPSALALAGLGLLSLAYRRRA